MWIQQHEADLCSYFNPLENTKPDQFIFGKLMFACCWTVELKKLILQRTAVQLVGFPHTVYNQRESYAEIQSSIN